MTSRFGYHTPLIKKIKCIKCNINKTRCTSILKFNPKLTFKMLAIMYMIRDCTIKPSDTKGCNVPQSFIINITDK